MMVMGKIIAIIKFQSGKTTAFQVFKQSQEPILVCWNATNRLDGFRFWKFCDHGDEPYVLFVLYVFVVRI